MQSKLQMMCYAWARIAVFEQQSYQAWSLKTYIHQSENRALEIRNTTWQDMSQWLSRAFCSTPSLYSCIECRVHSWVCRQVFSLWSHFPKSGCRICKCQSGAWFKVRLVNIVKQLAKNILKYFYIESVFRGFKADFNPSWETKRTA